MFTGMETIVLLALLGVGAWYMFRTESRLPQQKSDEQPDVYKKAILNGDHVLFVGDSLAIGLSPYLRKLAASSEVTLTEKVKSGAPIGWGMNQLVIPPLASVWLICLGANDAAAKPQRIGEKVKWIEEQARNDGVAVQWRRATLLGRGCVCHIERGCCDSGPIWATVHT
jgi:hypothetical protein